MFEPASRATKIRKNDPETSENKTNQTRNLQRKIMGKVCFHEKPVKSLQMEPNREPIWMPKTAKSKKNEFYKQQHHKNLRKRRSEISEFKHCAKDVCIFGVWRDLKRRMQNDHKMDSKITSKAFRSGARDPPKAMRETNIEKTTENCTRIRFGT